MPTKLCINIHCLGISKGDDDINDTLILYKCDRCTTMFLNEYRLRVMMTQVATERRDVIKFKKFKYIYLDGYPHLNSYTTRFMKYPYITYVSKVIFNNRI